METIGTLDEMLSVNFKNESGNIKPTFEKNGDSGFDLRAWVTDNDEMEIVLKPLERKLIHTGLYFEIPHNTEIQIRPRSGNALKHGITVLNSPATIDEGYRGELCVLLINLSDTDFKIKNGDRIAQAVICPVHNSYTVSLNEIKSIDTNTERGTGGFGHTGIN